MGQDGNSTEQRKENTKLDQQQENPQYELAVRGPPHEAHPFLCEELVMMELAQVHQETVRMCPGLPGGF